MATTGQDYEKAAKEAGLLEKVKVNEAYMDGYNGNTSSIHAQPSSLGLGRTLHQQYMKGKADKEAGKSASPPNVMAQAVSLGARRRRKTKKGKRKGRKSATRRR
jgi:hypothetical protein